MAMNLEVLMQDLRRVIWHCYIQLHSSNNTSCNTKLGNKPLLYSYPWCPSTQTNTCKLWLVYTQMSIYHLASLPLMIFLFNSNCIKVIWYHEDWSDHNKILHIPRQLCCLGMFKISLWSDWSERKYELTHFKIIQNLIKVSLVGLTPDIIESTTPPPIITPPTGHTKQGVADLPLCPRGEVKGPPTRGKLTTGDTLPWIMIIGKLIKFLLVKKYLIMLIW